jgi:hypothetical protein
MIAALRPPRRLPRRWAGALAAIVLLAPAAALAEDCPPSTHSVLRIERQTTGPRLDDTLDAAELTRRGGRATSFPENKGLGLFVAALSSEVALSGEQVAIGSAGFCATPREVVWRIGYVGKVIHVAHEIRDNACLAGMVLEHEKKHMVADETALVRFIGYLGADQQFALLEQRVPAAATPEAAHRQFAAATARLLGQALPALATLRAQLNAAVDTSGDGTGPADGCDGRDELVVRQALRAL